MKRTCLILFTLGLYCCSQYPKSPENEKTGSFAGHFEYGNFSDSIRFQIERDSSVWKVFFTSLAQNANRIPFQQVSVKGDSIWFGLQSDFYTYDFKNHWSEGNTRLDGSLRVDTITATFSLYKELQQPPNTAIPEEVSFNSEGLNINGTLWRSATDSNKGLVVVTSSGNTDRTAARAEAILFAQRGYTTFHYDKRGTGNSEGDWTTASIEELAVDDINAIKYFSEKANIPLSRIGIIGSSQGATKIPLILNVLDELGYGIVVSCPGVSLLESDLNYWKNRNSEAIKGNIEHAQALQRKVFKYIAGDLTRTELEKALLRDKAKPWFDKVWVPDLDKTRIDKKLLYSPIPHFEKTRQPVLIIQGALDEVIPLNSYQLISNALGKANNPDFETHLLDGASHSMYYIGNSDFPYWSKLHPEYIRKIVAWIPTTNDPK